MTGCGCIFKPCDPSSVKIRLPNGLVLGFERQEAQGNERGSPFSPHESANDPGELPPGLPTGSQASGSQYSQDSGNNGKRDQGPTGEPVVNTGLFEARSSAHLPRVEPVEEQDIPKVEEHLRADRPQSPTRTDEKRADWSSWVPPGDESRRLASDGNRKGLEGSCGRSFDGEGSSHQPIPEADTRRYFDPTFPQPPRSPVRNVRPRREHVQNDPKEQAQPPAVPAHATEPLPLASQGLYSVKIGQEQPTAASANAIMTSDQCLHPERTEQEQPAATYVNTPPPSNRCLSPQETVQDQWFMNPRKAPEPPTTRSPYVTIIHPEPLATVQANAPAADVPAWRQTLKERLHSAGRRLRGLSDKRDRSDASRAFYS